MTSRIGQEKCLFDTKMAFLTTEKLITDYILKLQLKYYISSPKLTEKA